MRRLFVLLVTAACLAPAPAMADWLTLRSDHFLLIGNASESQLLDVALRLEQFRAVVAQLSPRLLREESAPPVVVLAFHDSRTYEPFMPRVNGRIVQVGGFFQPGRDINYITINLQAGEEAYRVVFHEFSHLLVRGAFADAPLWFNEGLAEYYSTFEVVNDGRRANIGKPIPSHVALLRERRLAFSEFFAVDRSSRAYNENVVERRVLYAQAWAVVHHAFHSDGKRRDQLLTFVNRIANGSDTATSFRETYQMEPGALEREIQDYVRNQIYQYGAVDVPDSLVVRINPRQTPISDAEADAWLADLLAHMGRYDEAAARARQALAVLPDSELAHAVLGTVDLRQGRTVEGLDHLQRAVAGGSSNERVLFTYANALIESSPRTTDALTRAAAALERAMALRPGYAEARLLLAYSYLLLGSHEKTRDLLTPVVRAEPGNHQAALLLAQAFLRLNDAVAARRLLGPVAARASSEAERERARQLLAASASVDRRRDTIAAAGLTPSAPSETASTGDSRGAPPSAALVPAFRQTGADERRVYGIFEAVECEREEMTLVVRTANGVLRARTTRLSDVEFITYRSTNPSSVGCGKQPTPVEVYLTWRVPPGTATPSEGQAVALEFLPEGFVP